MREGATIPEGRLAKYRTAGGATRSRLHPLVLGLFVASGTGAVLS